MTDHAHRSQASGFPLCSSTYAARPLRRALIFPAGTDRIGPQHDTPGGIDQVRCHMCGHTESKVVDSRPTHDSTQVRRRRECLACQSRFTTYEVLEVTPLLVIKKDGRREEFARDKLLGGLR